MATFKSVWMKKVIDNVAKKVFAVSHVKSTYYDYSDGDNSEMFGYFGIDSEKILDLTT